MGRIALNCESASAVWHCTSLDVKYALMRSAPVMVTMPSRGARYLIEAMYRLMQRAMYSATPVELG